MLVTSYTSLYTFIFTLLRANMAERALFPLSSAKGLGSVGPTYQVLLGLERFYIW